MRILKIIAVAAVALPALAQAQVGPNPAVSGGSQDPTIGGSTDSVTAPQDAQIGTPPRGNVLDRPIGRSDATVSDGGAATAAVTPAAAGPMQTTDPQTAAAPSSSSKRTRRR
jgi:hypothetical protein